jgi:Transposase
MQTITTIGLDIAKSVFQVHCVDAEGKVILRRQLKRRYVLAFFQKLPPCLVGIEACASAHHWSRELQALGHTVRLMPPAYVKPYVKRHKNDATDAEAICEAVTRPNMRFVATKTPEQQSCLTLHDNTNGLGQQVMQEPQPLGHHLVSENIDAGRIAAGPGEAGDRVFGDKEDDRDRRCCGFGSERGGQAYRGDRGHLSADQIGHQCRQAIVMALQPVILDRHVLAFHGSGFVEAFAEPSHITGIGPGMDKPDHRQRRLLRARRDRPRCGCERGYKLPSSNADCH